MSDTRPIKTDGKHVPQPMKEAEMWVVWAPDEGKVALAPWQHKHMYPADWSKDGPHDPRTDYNQASNVADMSPELIDKRWPFPDEPPEEVLPAVLLPPDEVDNDYCFVDLDDVIIDGEITEEAWDILSDLGGYAEVSKSFVKGQDVAGVHAWVRGELPDGYGNFIAPLEGEGQIEIYDHGRMTGGTWRHVRGAPKDTVPDAQDTIEALIERYEVKSCPQCDTDIRKRELPNSEPACPECGYEFTKKPGVKETIPKTPDSGNKLPKEQNEYYNIDVRKVANTGDFQSYRTAAANPVNNKWQGPHPIHAATSNGKDDEKSVNFIVDPNSNQWYCFAHQIGGGALQLIAQLEGITTCGNSDEIHDDRDKLLQTVFAARNEYGMNGEKPPYQAMVRLAEMMDMPFADPEEEILGKITYKHTRAAFDEFEDYEQLQNETTE